MKLFLNAIMLSFGFAVSALAHSAPDPRVDALINKASAEVEKGNFRAFLRTLDPTLESQQYMPSVIGILQQFTSVDPEFRVLFIDDTGQSGLTITSAVFGGTSALYFSTTYLKTEDGLRMVHFSAQGNYKDVVGYK